MTNFNFKANWEKLCMPLMRTEQIQKEIKRGVKGYMTNRRLDYIHEYKLNDEQKQLKYTDKKEYNKLIQKNKYTFGYEEFIKFDYPLKYAQGDSICNIDDEIEERVIHLLTENNILKKNINKPSEFINEEGELIDCSDDDIMNDYMSSDQFDAYEQYKYGVISPYLNVEKDKDFRYYCLYGGCHWYNSTFGITLARMVMPHIKWKLIIGDFHTTVASDDEKLVFDILYYDNNDTDTFGGKQAIIEATRE